MDQFFFCLGLPKSGTTFLQRTLDLHPQISCPSEHNLAHLTKELERMYSKYNKILNEIDRRTGGQGARFVDQPILKKILKETILSLATSKDPGKSICGLNDNSILDRLQIYSEIMDHPPIIFIIRNPIDQGLSAWRHNHRLAKEENNSAHIEIMSQHGGTLEGWLNFCARKFNETVEQITQFSKAHGNIITVRYEELVTNKATELSRLVHSLGGDTGSETIDKIVEESDLDKMASNSKHPNFFGEGNTELGGAKISDELRAEILSLSREAMMVMGYSAP